MKKKSIIFRLLFMSIITLSLMTMVSCAKENTGMDAHITVKLMSDTSVVIPNIKVEISQQDIIAVGYTDKEGKYQHTFNQPVILNLKVVNDTLFGSGVISLADYGKDYSTTVYVY